MPLDFLRISRKEPKKEGLPVEISADFKVGRSKDLMIQGGDFYAVWDEGKKLWSRDKYEVQRLVDEELYAEAERLRETGLDVKVKPLSVFSNGTWNRFNSFCKAVSDNSHPLDAKLTFADTEVKKSDHVSRRLPYALKPGEIKAYDELISRLYEPVEREKIEWAIGAVIAGAAKNIQKFLVFFGGPGTGKSTIMDLIAELVGGKVTDNGYAAFFDAQALVGSSSGFALEAFKDNPLVAIQHDGNLSRIEDNSRLNSIVSHEDMTINEKFKSTYAKKVNAFLFMGTNSPVRITDGKSGLIRRLIDVVPTGETFAPDHYYDLLSRLKFEHGAIAYHCLQVYKTLGKNKYSDYQPTAMMMKTDVIFNFVEAHFDIFKRQDAVTIKQAWGLWGEYKIEAGLQDYKITQIRLREALKDYFDEFHERKMINGEQLRKVFVGFSAKQFKTPTVEGDPTSSFTLVMEHTESILDEMYAGMPAQYANVQGNPRLYWTNEERIDKNTGEPFIPKPDQVCSTVLGDLDTTELHFLKVPGYHIVIDFDLEDENGNKSRELNEAAAADGWPHTYAEYSKSGEGVHLHYIWDGDPSELARVYSEGIEIKVFTGNSSLRRKLTKCNNVAVATISGGLPFKEKKVLSQSSMKSEEGLRQLILKNLRKEVHPGTKPSIDFIKHLLDQAYEDPNFTYDLTDLRPKVMAFANNSQKNAMYCLKCVSQMKFKSETSAEEAIGGGDDDVQLRDDRLVFFDCEVYPNLFVVCWKYQGASTVTRLINPTQNEIQGLITSFKLVGFNNRGYDNHILYARSLGATNEELYQISQKIIVERDQNATFDSAWNLSYADVYDFSVEKKSLKKWEIDLGIPHVEMDIPWDKPVPESKILKVVEYCCNDVNALEAVFEHCLPDFAARQALAEMSGLTVNQSTRQHAIRIMFGRERNPQRDFVYTDLSEMFPGYEFNEYSKGVKSTYRGEDVGEGGYVYAEPGIYENVAVLDVASMHPTSIIELNYFGKYTPNFVRLVEARLAIKHGDFKRAQELLPGIQVDESNAKALSNALKLVINSIYGYTAAKFMNPFRDLRNKDNIVAKRGALFMIDLMNAVQEQGFTVAHIKTDSIKIPNATPDIIAFVQEFGAKYGYTFEHEADYRKMCLVNDAVYIAAIEEDIPGTKNIEWTATGAEFKHPYVFKTLFSGEPVNFRDLCETKQVKEGAMYLRFPQGVIAIGEKEDEILETDIIDQSNPDNGDTHIGRSGLFVPVNPTQDEIQGGELLRIKDGKEFAVSGTKGYLWTEAETIRELKGDAVDRLVFEQLDQTIEGTGGLADIIDMVYYAELAANAKKSIEAFGSYEEFVAV